MNRDAAMERPASRTVYLPRYSVNAGDDPARGILPGRARLAACFAYLDPDELGADPLDWPDLDDECWHDA